MKYIVDVNEQGQISQETQPIALTAYIQENYPRGKSDEGYSWGAITVYVILGIVILSALIGTFFIVRQQSLKIIERLGKFKKVGKPGLNIKIPFIDSVVAEVDLKVQQMNVEVETKTKDNVFVKAIVAVQYFIVPEKAYEAYYRLNDPKPQITSFIFDTVRAKVPSMTLDQVFENKNDIADSVKTELTETMDDFGYGIIKALITDIDPDAKVKESMNEINAQQRLRVAANEKGEADKILLVKKAEGEAKSKKLQGEGIANQRKAIINGLRESVETFKESVEGTTAQDVMQLVLLTQYFDTLKELGQSSKNNTIMLPHSPAGMADLSEQMRNAMIVAKQV